MMDTILFWVIVTVSVAGPLFCLAVWVVNRLVVDELFHGPS